MKSFPFIMREKKFYLKILKGTVSRDFRPFCLWLKRFDLDPIRTGKNDFAKFYVFAEFFDRKVRKLGICEVNDYRNTRLFL